jgi:hypothetical protein
MRMRKPWYWTGMKKERRECWVIYKLSSDSEELTRSSNPQFDADGPGTFEYLPDMLTN